MDRLLLALGAVIAGPAGHFGMTDRVAANRTRLAGPSINLQFDLKIAFLAVAVHKVGDGGAAALNGPAKDLAAGGNNF